MDKLFCIKLWSDIWLSIMFKCSNVQMVCMISVVNFILPFGHSAFLHLIFASAPCVYFVSTSFKLEHMWLFVATAG